MLISETLSIVFVLLISGLSTLSRVETLNTQVNVQQWISIDPSVSEEEICISSDDRILLNEKLPFARQIIEKANKFVDKERLKIIVLEAAILSVLLTSSALLIHSPVSCKIDCHSTNETFIEAISVASLLNLPIEIVSNFPSQKYEIVAIILFKVAAVGAAEILSHIYDLGDAALILLFNSFIFSSLILMLSSFCRNIDKNGFS